MTKQQPQLFRPAVHPSKGGLLLVDYAGNRMTVADSEVERWIEELQEVRKRQLIRQCRDIAGCRSLIVVESKAARNGG